MKNFIYLALIPIVAVLLSDKIKASPDLIYSLSKEMRIQSTEGGDFENIQQLEVKNVGNEVAKNIIIKITGNIDGANVEKFSVDDKATDDLSHGNLEVRYESLMPGGSFFVVLKTKNKMVSNKLDIVYEKGKAVDAFSKEINYGRLAVITAYFAFIFLFIASFYSSYKDSLMRDARSYLAESVLRKNKPWIISEKYWQKICLTSKATMLKDYYKNRFSSVELSFPYIYLNSDMGLIRDVEIRNALSASACVALENIVMQHLADYHSVSSLEKMLLIEKPEHVSETSWIDISNKIQTRYVNRLKQEIIDNARSEKLYNDEDFKLDLLSKESKDNLMSFVEYYNLRRAKLILYNSNEIGQDYPEVIKYFDKTDPYNFYALAKRILFSNIDMACSTDKAKSLIGGNAHWLTKEDHKIIIETIKRSEWTTKLYKILKELVNSKQAVISREVDLDEESKQLVDKVISIINKEKKLDDKDAELEKELQLNRSTKDKVLDQLHFIDTLLSNPSIIDRVEEYEDTFSKVNYQNLKMISRVLRDMKE